jgi:hypothetical protein
VSTITEYIQSVNQSIKAVGRILLALLNANEVGFEDNIGAISLLIINSQKILM